MDLGDIGRLWDSQPSSIEVWGSRVISHLQPIARWQEDIGIYLKLLIELSRSREQEPRFPSTTRCIDLAHTGWYQGASTGVCDSVKAAGNQAFQGRLSGSVSGP